MLKQIFFLIVLFSVVKNRSFIFNPKAISSFKVSEVETFTAIQHEVTDDNKHAFISISNGVIYLITLEDIQQPLLKSIIKTKSAFDIKYKNGYLFVTDLIEGFIIFDLRNIDNPTRIYTLRQPLAM